MILSQWAAFQFYGDVDALAARYDAMTRYAAYLQSRANDRLLSFGLGDWYDIGPNPPGPSQRTSISLTGTAIYYQDLLTLARIAFRLDKPGDAAKFTAEANEVKAAFNRSFYHADTKSYDRGSQDRRCHGSLSVSGSRAGSIRSPRESRCRHSRASRSRHSGRHRLSLCGRCPHAVRPFRRALRHGHPHRLTQLRVPAFQGSNIAHRSLGRQTRPSSQNHFMLGHAEELVLSRSGRHQLRPEP